MYAAYRDSGDYEFVSGSQSRWKWPRVEIRKHVLCCVQISNEEMAPNLKMVCVGGVHPVAVGLERRAGSLERLCGPVQIARGKRDLGLSDDATGTRDRFFRTERAGRFPQEIFRS